MNNPSKLSWTKKIILLNIFLFLSACTNHFNTLNPPNWFLTIPNNNTNLYGNGMGKTLQEAKQSAINDLASNIKIKINSNTDIQNIQTDDEQSSKINQNIQLSLDTIELQKITFNHNEYKNKTYYVQIKIPKNILVQNLKNKYNLSYQKLESFLKNTCNSLSILDKNILQNSLQKLDSLKETIYILEPSNKIQTLQTYQNILNKNSPLPKAKLFFESQDNKEIIKALSAEYAKFIQISDEKNIYTIKNKISTQSQNNQIIIGLEVDIYDCKNNIVFHTQISSKQNSKLNAINRIKVKLYKILKEYSEGEINSDF